MKNQKKLSETLSDIIVGFIGSWLFVALQTMFVIAWVAGNIYGIFKHWDPYPFIFLNLFFSLQAAYATPIILMSQNRQSKKEKQYALEQLQMNLESKAELNILSRKIDDLDCKFDELIKLTKKETTI
jgi:uncharacterized membrane protein